MLSLRQEVWEAEGNASPSPPSPEVTGQPQLRSQHRPRSDLLSLLSTAKKASCSTIPASDDDRPALVPRILPSISAQVTLFLDRPMWSLEAQI